MNRKILHLDLDAFFCAVEELYDTDLVGKPFAVGGAPNARGVVASCSYAARLYGVRSAMPMARAIKLCPTLITIPHRHKTYTAKSRQVMSLLWRHADIVEQISIDEAFLDLSEQPGTGEVLACQIQAAIHKELKLPCSIGVATNKLVAKIATDVGKAAAQAGKPPNAIQVVPPGQEQAFLAPLPVEALWGVGPKTAARLAILGARTIGDIVYWPEADLAQHFGKHGHDLAQRARGIDDRPVNPHHDAKSFSRETTFAHDITKAETIHDALLKLCASVARRLQRARLSGTTVKLKIRWPDFTTLTRQTTLEAPVDQAPEIYAAAEKLLHQTWTIGRPVRLIGVGVSGLGPPIRQLSLFDPALNEAALASLKKERRLREVIEELQTRFGDRAVWWGSDPAGGQP